MTGIDATRGQAQREPVIAGRGIVTRLGGNLIHDGIDITVRHNEVLAIAGGSGSGKSVLMRVLCLLLRPSAGVVHLFGRDAESLDPAELVATRQRLGVMFQRGALFTGLSVLENVAFPLREHAGLGSASARELAAFKLELTGFPAAAVHRSPAALSGGMLKRAALARALALDPEVVFLDEPSAGLDPVSAGGLDDLLLRLVEDLALTVVVITHDVDSLWRITDRVAFLGEGRLLAIGPVAEVARSEHPVVQAYFAGPRSRRAQGSVEARAAGRAAGKDG